MVTLSPSSLLDWLVRNHFLAAARAQALSACADAHGLARELIQRDWLTPFQANQILAGNMEFLVLGPYRLIERLGQGSMGEVFKAWDVKRERHVALKMIHKENLSFPRAMERFRREMETSAQLDHPNIVVARDADELVGRPYMVMDFVEGTDLSRLVKHGGPLAIHLACAIGRQVALGLQHAYERGVVHRDIKPGNLLLMRPTEMNPALVKILDFGLARFDDERGNAGRLTQDGAVIGTVDYIAPEQAVSAKIADTRSDIYSLGCTLYFLLTGRPAFPGASVVDKIAARRIGTFPSLRDLRPEAPPALDRVLAKMAAREPADRFQTPVEVAHALEPFTVPLATPVQVVLEPIAVPSAPPFFNLDGADTPLDLGVGEPFAFESLNQAGAPCSRAGVRRATQSARRGRARKRRVSRRRPSLWIWLGAGAALMTLLVVIAFVINSNWGDNTDSQASAASLSVHTSEKQATFNLAENKLRKTLIVQIERFNVKGPVSISVDGLPDGIRAEGKPIAEDRDRGEIHITVSFGTPTLEATVWIVATAGALSDRTPLQLKVVGQDLDAKKKRAS